MGWGKRFSFLGGESESEGNCSAWGPHGQPARHRQRHRMLSPPFIASLSALPSQHVAHPLFHRTTWHQSFPSTLGPTLLPFQTRMWSSLSLLLPSIPISNLFFSLICFPFHPQKFITLFLFMS